MPETRCKWYEADGTPVRGGCPTPGCRFVHPGQRSWSSRPPYRPVRCMFFDSSGRPLRGGCRSGSSCRFVHPNDRDWNFAQIPRSHLERQSSSPAVSSASRSTLPDSDQRTVAPKENKIVHRLPPSLRTQGRDLVEPRPSMLSGSSAYAQRLKDLPAITTQFNVGADQRPAPHSIPKLQLSSTSSLYSPVNPERSPMVSTPPAFKSADTDSQEQAWKKRIILLTQAQEVVLEMNKIEQRLELETRLPSGLETFVSSSSNEDGYETPTWSNGMNLELLQNKRKVLEDKLNPIVSQLVEEDIWSLPTEPEADVSVGQHQLYLSASIAEFDRRLDLLESQANKIREMGRVHEDHSIKDEGASRASKRRRIAGKGFVQTPLDAQEILARLDRLQGEATVLEAETLHDERLLELVDERAEDWLLERASRPTHSLQDAVQKLDADLNVLCGKLADSDTDNLASQVETLRSETGDMMRAVDLLASEMHSVRLRDADLGQQTQKLLEELIESGRAPRDQTYFTGGYDNSELTVDVQQHIDTAMTQIHSTIQSRHEEIKHAVLASLEPTILKAEAIYRSLSSQPEADEQPSSE